MLFSLICGNFLNSCSFHYSLTFCIILMANCGCWFLSKLYNSWPKMAMDETIFEWNKYSIFITKDMTLIWKFSKNHMLEFDSTERFHVRIYSDSEALWNHAGWNSNYHANYEPSPMKKCERKKKQDTHSLSGKIILSGSSFRFKNLTMRTSLHIQGDSKL